MKKISSILATSILSTFLFAQQNLVTFEYDAAGNRVKRHTNQNCEPEKVHNLPFTINHNLYKAEDFIESTIFVSANDTLTYKAGDYILLKSGFKVLSQAKFEASIEICDITHE